MAKQVKLAPLSSARVVIRGGSRASSSGRPAGPRRRERSPREGLRWRRGVADGAIAAGASGTVSLHQGAPGSETDTGRNVTAYNDTDVAVSASARVLVYSLGRGWYVLPLECA